jgi:hypothetical protein
MMVLIGIGVESRPLLRGTHACNDALGFEEAQRAIDRVEGNGGDSRTDPLVDRLSAGVFGGASQLAVDLGSLVRSDDAVLSAHDVECLQATLDDLPISLQRKSSVMITTHERYHIWLQAQAHLASANGLMDTGRQCAAPPSRVQ